MAIKVNGATVITNSRRGVFRTVNPGSYSTANRPPGASEGDVIYDSDEKNIYVFNGEEWVGTGGGAINNLNPAIPPFISTTGPETVVTNSDGKVQFSLDGTIGLIQLLFHLKPFTTATGRMTFFRQFTIVNMKLLSM